MLLFIQYKSYSVSTWKIFTDYSSSQLPKDSISVCNFCTLQSKVGNFVNLSVLFATENRETFFSNKSIYKTKKISFFQRIKEAPMFIAISYFVGSPVADKLFC